MVKQELRYCGTEEGKIFELRKMLVDGLVYPCLIFMESRQRADELFKEILLCDKNILASILSSEKSEAQVSHILSLNLLIKWKFKILRFNSTENSNSEGLSRR